MRETEASLQQFGEYLLREQLAPGHVAPHMVRWVRHFLARDATDEPIADQARRFCDNLARSGTVADWQVRQAEQALRLYFVSFLERADWRLRPPAGIVDKDGRVDPPRVLDEMRRRLRTRHYALRTESAYVDWAGRFLAALAERQAAPRPRIEASSVRDYLTHLAVRRRVSASTQNQAFCALLFLCRNVLGIDVDGLGDAARARRGERLPTVMSVPETASLLSAMRGTPRLMASLIYGGGLRVSECCELRVKDLDFDQGLVLVRNGKGDKDRATLLADGCRDDLRAQLAASERLHRADRAAGLAGVWLPDAIERKYRNAGLEFGWFWVFPSGSLSTDPRAGIVRRRDPQARVRPYAAPLLRDAPAPERRRHPADPGVPRPRQRRDDDDLHARREGLAKPAAERARHAPGSRGLPGSSGRWTIGVVAEQSELTLRSRLPSSPSLWGGRSFSRQPAHRALRRSRRPCSSSASSPARPGSGPSRRGSR